MADHNLPVEGVKALIRGGTIDQDIPAFRAYARDNVPGGGLTPSRLGAGERRFAAAVDARRLGEWVAELAVPRSYFGEPAANRRIARRVADGWLAAGLAVSETGSYGSMMARLPGAGGEDPPAVIVAAHLDSVAGSPGADDNASGLAALLTIGEVLAAARSSLPLALVAFNAEEDGLLGSRELAPVFAAASPPPRVVHVLEMIGYRDPAPGAQRPPPGLPIPLPACGDFLGLVGDRAAADSLRHALGLSIALAGSPPVIVLEVERGVGLAHPLLRRSDHSPFWQVGVPAVMWTDTAELRNPHYHLSSDLPESLDLDFLTGVTRLVLLTAMADAAANR